MEKELNGKVHTVNELYIKIKGDFTLMNERIDNLKSTTYWIGALSGGIISGLIIGAFKVFGS